MLSTVMKVIEIFRPGGPDVLQIGHHPIPVPGPDDVLIRIEAAGVNRPDIFQRQGLYPPPPGSVDTPGLEVAGTIDATGKNVNRWQPGDRVCALLNGGGYAEYAIAPEVQCLPIPDGMTSIEAAAMPETFFTVWSNVFDRGKLQPGESFLVHGGTSGIGTAALQIAANHGARVFATAGTKEKCKTCEMLGAEAAVNYKTEDFVAILNDRTGGKGIDVILDMVAGDYVARDIEVAAVEGRIIFIAVLGGTRASIDVTRLMFKRLTLTGSTLRAQSVESKAAIARALEKNVWPLVESGRIKPLLHATFPLAEAARAHRMMESGEHMGKIVLSVAS